MLIIAFLAFVHKGILSHAFGSPIVVSVSLGRNQYVSTGGGALFTSKIISSEI